MYNARLISTLEGSIIVTRLRYQVFAFAITRTVINTAYRMIYPFLPTIARGLGVSVESITLGITLRSALGLFSPALGSIGDIKGRKVALLLGVGLFTAGMVLVALWPTYPALLVSLLLVGVSKIIFDPAMYAYLGDRVAYERRGLAIAVSEFGWSGAFLLGIPVTGWLIAQSRWHSPFPWLALFGGGLMIALWGILPHDVPVTGTRPSFWQGAKTIMSDRTALAGLTISLLLNASNEVVNIVYGLWMENSFGLQVAALGAASAIIGLSELGGEGLVAGFVDRVGKRRAVGGGLVCFALACLLLPVLGHTLEGALVGLFLFYLAFEFTLVSSIPLMTELVPRARATLMAGNVAALSLGRVMGSLLGPVLFLSGLPTNAVVAAGMNVAGFIILLLFVREGGQEAV
jgi:predicted MFS family arabinose efflux permease